MSRTARRRVSYPGDVEDAMPEGNLARWLATYLIETILRHVGVPQRHAAYANLPIYYVEGEPRKHVSPDAFFLEGVPHDHDLKSYRLFETGVVPTVAFEILSVGSKKKDRVKNREVYAELGIEEYYWFDPDHAKLEALRLDRRTGRYEPAPMNASGRYESSHLGLEVGVNGRLLGLFSGGEYLQPTEKLLRERESDLAERDRELAERDRELAELDRELAERDRAIAERDEELAKRAREIVERERALAEEQLRRAELERRIRELEGRS